MRTLSDEDFSKLPEPEAIAYLFERFSKLHSQLLIIESTEPSKALDVSDLFDQHVVMSEKCSRVLAQAMKTFPDFLALRQVDPEQHVRKWVLPQALIHEGYDANRYTQIFAWVAEGFTRLAKESHHLYKQDINNILALKDRVKRKFRFKLSHTELFPSMWDGRAFRGFDLYDILFNQEILELVDLIWNESFGDSVAFERWSIRLEELGRQKQIAQQRIESDLVEYIHRSPYEGSEHLRLKLTGTLEPSNKECSMRFWSFYSGLCKGKAQDQQDIKSQLDIIKKNEQFCKNNTRLSIIEGIEDLALDGSIDDIQCIEREALSQIAWLVKEFDVPFISLIDSGVQHIAKLSPDTIASIEEWEKPSLILKARHGSGVNLFDPEKNMLDAYILLIFKCANEGVIDSISLSGDYGAALAYSISGKSKHIRRLKDSQVIDGILNNDLGI